MQLAHCSRSCRDPDDELPKVPPDYQRESKSNGPVTRIRNEPELSPEPWEFQLLATQATAELLRASHTDTGLETRSVSRKLR